MTHSLMGGVLHYTIDVLLYFLCFNWHCLVCWGIDDEVGHKEPPLVRILMASSKEKEKYWASAEGARLQSNFPSWSDFGAHASERFSFVILGCRALISVSGIGWERIGGRALAGNRWDTMSA